MDAANPAAEALAREIFKDPRSDPFQLTEKDGYFYGRGTLDMKSGDAIMAATLLRLRRGGVRASRDIILALTADEEGGCYLKALTAR